MAPAKPGQAGTMLTKRGRKLRKRMLQHWLQRYPGRCPQRPAVAGGDMFGVMAGIEQVILNRGQSLALIEHPAELHLSYPEE